MANWMRRVMAALTVGFVLADSDSGGSDSDSGGSDSDSGDSSGSSDSSGEGTSANLADSGLIVSSGPTHMPGGGSSDESSRGSSDGSSSGSSDGNETNNTPKRKRGEPGATEMMSAGDLKDIPLAGGDSPLKNDSPIKK